MVPGLAAALSPGSEVVLHDLGRVPDSVVAIAGGLTGRRVRSPTTDLLLQLIRQGRTDDLLNYRTRCEDGRWMRSSTLFVRDDRGRAVGCLCINQDVTLWAQLDDLARWQLGNPISFSLDTPDHPPRPSPERFPGDVEGLRRAMVERAVERVGVPVHLMQKAHKVQVVRQLEAEGFFLIREAVEYLARALDVTRYTVYNYLNEVRSRDDAETSRQPEAGQGAMASAAGGPGAESDDSRP